MDKTDKNTIEELLPRYCEGLATEEERLQVEMWMDESEENRRMAKQIHALYLATDTVHIMTKVDTEKALTKVGSRNYKLLFRVLGYFKISLSLQCYISRVAIEA